jgi:hypothetical protein
VITIKLNIKENGDSSFVLKKQKEYSYAFRKLYVCNNINDVELANLLKIRYNLNTIEYRSLIEDVKTKKSQMIASKTKIEESIVELTLEISKLKEKDKLTKKEIRNLFKLNNSCEHSKVCDKKCQNLSIT